MSEKEEKSQSFRDSLSTLDKEGKRRWIYPKKPSGTLYTYRKLVSYLLLLLLFGSPFIKINGEPLLMLNILTRKFVIFGQVFWPQDFHLFVFAMVAFVLFIVLFTVVFGRVFCGWICPQTIFMEMLFRRIEYWLEGDWQQQIERDRKKETTEYYLKKSAKHTIFFIISFLIANTFLAYIIGSDSLMEIIVDNPDNHIGGLISILIFTLVFYFVFSRLREQVCTNICPYGRLQSVLLDRNSIIVAYDYIRGENRGKFKKGEVRNDSSKGDCIDCGQCVNVCPTGIDIRNGTQLECVNCTACIDACDYMMENVGLKKGLIRYASEATIADKTPFIYTVRAKAYTAVLASLTLAFFILLFSRSEVETTLLRTPGILYQDQGDGNYSNLYNYKIVNKTNDSIALDLKLESIEGKVKLVGSKLTIQKNEIAEGALFVIINKSELEAIKTKIKIGVYKENKRVETLKTSFVGPS